MSFVVWSACAVLSLGGRTVEGELEEPPPIEVGQCVIADVEPGSVGFTRRLRVTEPEPLTFRGSSVRLDLLLRVEDRDGRPLAEDDDSGTATNPHLVFTPPAPGDYSIRLLGKSGRSKPAALYVLRGALEPGVPEPALGEQSYWELAALFAHRDEDEVREEECLSWLSELLGEAPESTRRRCEGAVERFDRTAALHRQAKKAAKEGDWSAAKARVQEAFGVGQALWREGFQSIAALTFENLDRLARELKLPEAALEAMRLEVELESRVRPPYEPLLTIRLIHLAMILHELGMFAEARAIEERVLAVFRETRPATDRERIDLELNLAADMREMGDLTSAYLLEEAVLARLEGFCPEDDPQLQRAAWNLSVTAGRRGMTERRAELRRRRLAYLERTLPPDDLERLDFRASLDSEDPDPEARERAVAARRRILEIKERTLPPGHRDIARARDDLGHAVAVRGGTPEEAYELRLRALREWQAALPPGDPYVLTALRNVAWMARNRGDGRALVGFLTEFFEGALQRLESARTLSRREARAVAMGESSDHRAALGLSERAPADRELAFAEFSWLETRRLVATGTGFVRGDATGPRLESIRKSVIDAAVEVASVVTGAGRPEVAELRSAVDEQNRRERELFEAQGSTPLTVTLRDLANALPEDGVAVGFVRYHSIDWSSAEGGSVEMVPKFRAYVVRRDQGLQRTFLERAHLIDDAIYRWRAAIGAPVGPEHGTKRYGAELDPEEAGRELRRLVLDPILECLLERNPFGLPEAKRFYVCLDDVLHLVPLDCLPLDDGGLVGDRYEIHREVSFARLLAPPPPPDGPRSLLAMGGIAFDDSSAPVPSLVELTRSARDGFPRLPHSGHEVEDVAKRFESRFQRTPRVLSGREASKGAFCRYAPRSTVLHLATHGYFREPQWVEPRDVGRLRPGSTAHPERELAPFSFCGLAFAGANLGEDGTGRLEGVMTAEEIAALDLSRCELAVLSACDSGVGLRAAGAGIASLQAAFQAAGARSSIAALWTVDDRYTREFMNEFYELLWSGKEGGGMTKSEALRKARECFRRRGLPMSLWAAWALTGDPDRGGPNPALAPARSGAPGG